MITTALVGATWSGAVAEDFSGFYAGLNAGYARQAGEREDRGPGPLTGQADIAAPESRLPPSARSASETIQARNRAVDRTVDRTR
ncbi:hypothetical protein [Methylobacterium sp. BTF04]|uniref:hypothetical protein n=1 Tax=Methylobacterium sp. BTF04 TaxID=2708300 RepID=UPI001952F3B3|nr:hypothetical protein [Methylobacterium sp. BTF04]